MIVIENTQKRPVADGPRKGQINRYMSDTTEDGVSLPIALSQEEWEEWGPALSRLGTPVDPPEGLEVLLWPRREPHTVTRTEPSE